MHSSSWFSDVAEVLMLLGYPVAPILTNINNVVKEEVKTGDIKGTERVMPCG